MRHSNRLTCQPQVNNESDDNPPLQSLQDETAEGEEVGRQRENIKVELRMAGSSLAQVARELGVSRQFVSAVLGGQKRSERIEEHIARTVGIPVGQLWTDREPLNQLGLEFETKNSREKDHHV
jgi:Ner family transcriptional regulator